MFFKYSFVNVITNIHNIHAKDHYFGMQYITHFQYCAIG